MFRTLSRNGKSKRPGRIAISEVNHNLNVRDLIGCVQNTNRFMRSEFWTMAGALRWNISFGYRPDFFSNDFHNTNTVIFRAVDESSGYLRDGG